MARSVSTAERLQRLFKKISQLQHKHKFERRNHYDREALFGEPYHMSSEEVDTVVNGTDEIVKWLGKMPWK